MIKFFVPGKFPGLNEIIAASRKELKWLRKGKKRVYQDTEIKKEWTERVAQYFITEIGIPKNPLNIKIFVNCTWIEKDNRRDPDNVFGGGQKMVFDGLELSGIIHRDSRKWIAGINHKFGENDKNNPGVWIEINF